MPLLRTRTTTVKRQNQRGRNQKLNTELTPRKPNKKKRIYRPSVCTEDCQALDPAQTNSQRHRQTTDDDTVSANNSTTDTTPDSSPHHHHHHHHHPQQDIQAHHLIGRNCRRLRVNRRSSRRYSGSRPGQRSPTSHPSPRACRCRHQTPGGTHTRATEDRKTKLAMGGRIKSERA